ncbi:MAG TPA: glycosyltransferase family A protein [Actinocrinis sp.]|jgi:glycosyltransferase involved in cell wall biosynthesis|uniref:glycosyltransferase family 2 protein n=1 Tax=Actinocrinis sp. TaxID=1920516 RepID=UPI002D3105AD|nr:glycosyltransferase family A protein [Actinocrinis sp.]HZU58696.1 glycosyltransferase family A protein [Actinocrinis sp.]
MIRRTAKRILRRRFGWLPLYELRNKVLLAHTVPGNWLFETREVHRLRKLLPDVAPSLVTTVIPTYKRADALRAAVESALSQTIADNRVIIVDDGGGQIPPLPEDPRVVAVSLRRNTAVAGVVRNVGVRLASSPFVAFLDDDNLWEPEHLATALAALEARPKDRSYRLDGVYTALRRVTPDGREMDILSVPYDRRLAREKSFFDTNAFVARRNRALRFSRLRRHKDVMPREDWVLLYRYARHHRIAHIPVPTVRYLVNPNTYYTVWDRSLD